MNIYFLFFFNIKLMLPHTKKNTFVYTLSIINSIFMLASLHIAVKRAGYFRFFLLDMLKYI